MRDASRNTGNVAAGPIAWMARRSIAANLMMMLLLGGGAWTALRVQKEVLPRYELDVVEVRVAYPGAAPSEVEQGILLPIEEAVRGVSGIREISSTAREGSGRVSIELVTGTENINEQDTVSLIAEKRTGRLNAVGRDLFAYIFVKDVK